MSAPSSEEQIKASFDSGDRQAAVTQAIELYGAEIFSFMFARLRDQDLAGDGFSEACEDLWKSIETFQWRCSMRTWFYKLARSVATRIERKQRRREFQASDSMISGVADKVRSATLVHLKTEIKDRFSKLREELAPEDQTLLILRINRGLPWNEVAMVMSDGDCDEADLKRVSARLRQRFQTLRSRLRERAVEEGLVPPDRDR